VGAAERLSRNRRWGDRIEERYGESQILDRRIDVRIGRRVHRFEDLFMMRAIRNAMVLASPFIISKSEDDEIINLAWRCFDLTARDLGKSTG
jgi:hypothetical protein